jgi:hypothetical protein
MSQISKYTSGALAKTTKANEVIDAVNSLINMTVRTGSEGESPSFTYAKGGSTLNLGGKAPENEVDPNDADGDGGYPGEDFNDPLNDGTPDEIGGDADLPSFVEETLDVVNANNTAGQRVFLTRAV